MANLLHVLSDKVEEWLAPEPPPLVSGMCTEKALRSPVFKKWSRDFGEKRGHMHRKIWEWCFIAQALKERGMLQPGKIGLGFAVGTEPLSAIFATYGPNIVATDLFTQEAQERGWVATDQHADGYEAINTRGHCDPKKLRELVEFKFCDMNAIDPAFEGKFDFVWSSCSLEHLGSLQHGKDFIYNAMKCLKPGGWAVHTTEYNVSSNDATLDSGPTVLYRKRDIEEIAATLRAQGHHLEIDWDQGQGYADGHIDLPPYQMLVHLKLQIAEYVVTSFGMIIRKAG